MFSVLLEGAGGGDRDCCVVELGILVLPSLTRVGLLIRRRFEALSIARIISLVILDMDEIP